MSALVCVNAGAAVAAAVAAVARVRISVANINIMFISSVNGFGVHARSCTRFVTVENIQDMPGPSDPILSKRGTAT